MEHVFLDYIYTSKKEDLTTSILEYLFQQKEDDTISSVFFETLGVDIIPYDTEQQKSIERGFIDLFIETSQSLIIIENKFDAAFTWNEADGHQLHKYCKWLNKEKYKTKYLVILTIGRRKKEVESYINTELLAFTDIKKLVIYWEEFLPKCLLRITNDKIQFITNSLNEYIGKNFSKLFKLSDEGINMLYSKEFSNAFIEISGMINKIKEKISNDSILKLEYRKTSLYEPDYDCIGVYFNNKNNEYWFGLNPGLGSKDGFPLYLQVMNESRQSNKYLDNGFVSLSSEKTSGIMYKFCPDEAKDEDRLYNRIRELAI